MFIVIVLALISTVDCEVQQVIATVAVSYRYSMVVSIQKYSAITAKFTGKAALGKCVHPDSGKKISHGGRFQISSSGPCIEYTCQNGGYSATSVACSNDDGSCTPIGSIKQISNCLQQQCKTSGGHVGFATTKEGCMVRSNGRSYECVPVGQSVTEDCITKRCSLNGNTYRLQVHDAKCKIGGQCKPVGSSWTEQCLNVKCDKRDYPDGSVQLIQTRSPAGCTDTTGKCHQAGEKGYSTVKHGRLYTDCTCNLDGHNYRSVCTQTTK
ncbi:hypothetical protein LOTGIDRAFT_157589 [Lottia gigantea]|uniref:SRCR domain-containing protein n=1 Tax=Lottia gigantea TaxID=225164 RepID=V4AVN9_LOTGI|nr:hypothetical protein LOTGIDRAFT_157589 [Lottia gigantea]ESP01408.1 hypothetical protein LOTGIDRAFT_157589 [Lottia gigantea]